MTRLRSQSQGVPSSSGWDSDPTLELRPSDPRPGPIPPGCVMLAEALDSSGVGTVVKVKSPRTSGAKGSSQSQACS